MFKKIFITLLIFSFCFSSISCDYLYSKLDKAGAEEKKLVGEIVPFQSNEVILDIQQLLGLYGYNPGKPDGKLGLNTRNAIERFQRDNGLKNSRVVDAETWNKLIALRNCKLIKGSELNVKVIQYVLKELGYNIGAVDGEIGPATARAVKAFQKDHGLTVDGRIGYKTLLKMANYVEVKK